MNYKSYQNMRDSSWKILLDCGVDRLPVDINAVCHSLGVRVLSYDEGAEVIERAHLYRAVRHTSGLTFYLQGTPVILFDETLDKRQIAVTVAHELGHIILCHIRPGIKTAGHQGAHWKVVQEEKEADQFAARLLAPACVLWGLNIHMAEEIAALCCITGSAAKCRAKRMAELYRRNKFLASPLERAVYRQFRPFIAGSACPPQVGRSCSPSRSPAFRHL